MTEDKEIKDAIANVSETIKCTKAGFGYTKDIQTLLALAERYLNGEFANVSKTIGEGSNGVD